MNHAKKLVEAARRIQRTWRRRRDQGLYGTLRETIASFQRSGEPYLLLRAVLPREAVLLDPAMQVHVRFRLGGPRHDRMERVNGSPDGVWLWPRDWVPALGCARLLPIHFFALISSLLSMNLLQI